MAKMTKENIDRWFELDLDVDTRTIYLGSISVDTEGQESGVDCIMAERLIKSIHVLRNKGDSPINIIMNNPGGNWFHGLAIYDCIKLCKNSTINIKVFGHAMSMGSIILQAGDNRILAPHSRFMLHYGETGHINHLKNVQKWVDFEKKEDYILENIYLDKMMEKDELEGIGYLDKVLSDVMNKQKELEFPTPKIIKYKFPIDPIKRREKVRIVLKELLNFDTILVPEEVVALGLADEVLE